MKFGQFDGICNQNALTVCPLLGEINGVGLQPACYARNLEVTNTGVLIFQPAALFIRIVTIFMCGIMIFHISSKYTAVGRKEMVTFFYLFLLDTIISMLLVSNIIPMAWQGSHYFVAIDFGLVVACFWCLMLNGFISFQFMEDGTRLSVWGVRISSFVIGLFSAFVAIATFESTAGFRKNNPILLWIMMYIFTGVCLLVYVVSQILLVFKTMRDRWPLGDIIFGIVFFAIGQIITIGIGETICNATRHYLDGTFFGACSVLLAVMFIYKYWDSITKEDLEFSVGGKQNVWEVKDVVDEEEFAYGPTKPHGGYGSYPMHSVGGHHPYDQSTVYGSDAGVAYDQPHYGAAPGVGGYNPHQSYAPPPSSSHAPQQQYGYNTGGYQ